jgi:hypothetical protein
MQHRISFGKKVKIILPCTCSDQARKFANDKVGGVTAA